MIKVKYHSEEPGFDRVYYTPIDPNDKRLFCLQTRAWYICSRDGEPSHSVDDLEIVGP